MEGSEAWWIATLVFVHCARGMMLMQNIQKKYFVMDNTKKKNIQKKKTPLSEVPVLVGGGWGDLPRPDTYHLPGPTPTTYPPP